MNHYDTWDGTVVDEHNHPVAKAAMPHVEVAAFKVNMVAVVIGRSVKLMTESDARLLAAEVQDALQ